MPTATLVRRVGASSPSQSSLVVELVASSSSGGGSHNSQEVDNCNGKDASISVANSQSKNKIRQRLKEKTVAKKSKPGVKTRKYVYICTFKGCTKQAQKGGVCVTHGAIKKHKLCSHDGCTKQAVKGGVCITHGAKVKGLLFDLVRLLSYFLFEWH